VVAGVGDAPRDWIPPAGVTDVGQDHYYIVGDASLDAGPNG